MASRAPDERQRVLKQVAERISDQLQQSSNNRAYPAANLAQNDGEEGYAVEISNSVSVNTIASLHPDFMPEDLLAGQKIEGRMSNVRRFFCLFVTFDLLFICLMWIICVMLKGENILQAFNEQIYHYNIHTSLFDIVLVAFCRFAILILAYAILDLQHWSMIAISTTLSCVFLLGKVFVYEWPNSSQPVFEVLLVLISFILSWGEAWFLDFKVLPQEAYARRYFISNLESERAPLIRRYIYGPPASAYTESVGNFYTPVQSPEGSLYRIEGNYAARPYACKLTNAEEEKYRHLANKALDDSWLLLEHTDWRLEKKNGLDHVYCLTIPKTGRIYKITAELDIPPKCVLEELFYNVEKIPQWNPDLLEAHRLQIIDEYTDITYQISAAGGGGLVQSRDFITLRHWTMVEERSYLLTTISTEHGGAPIGEEYIRGENGTCCMFLQPLAEGRKCSFQWVFSVNLNLWIPKAVLKKALVEMLFNYVKYLRIHIKQINETERLV